MGGREKARKREGKKGRDGERERERGGWERGERERERGAYCTDILCCIFFSCSLWSLSHPSL